MGKDLATVLFLLLILMILWYAQGGTYKIGPPPTQTSRQAQTQRPPKQVPPTPTPKQTPPTPIGVSTTTADAYKRVSINYTRARTDDPDQEFLEIRYLSSRGQRPLRITGWELINNDNEKFTIGTGAEKIISTVDRPQKDIILQPGQSAVIITGSSPLSTNFLVNKCMGYFTQFRDFGNFLIKQCPHPKNEPEVRNLDEKCQIFIERLPRCYMPQSGLTDLAPKCQEYIFGNINYARCIGRHEADSDFYKNKWLIYLGKSDEIWKNLHDTITLKDQAGNIVTQVSY